jgi:hypothetical protein
MIKGALQALNSLVARRRFRHIHAIRASPLGQHSDHSALEISADFAICMVETKEV